MSDIYRISRPRREILEQALIVNASELQNRYCGLFITTPQNPHTEHYRVCVIGGLPDHWCLPDPRLYIIFQSDWHTTLAGALLSLCNELAARARLASRVRLPRATMQAHDVA